MPGAASAVRDLIGGRVTRAEKSGDVWTIVHSRFARHGDSAEI
ncbi:hypothetical protein GCM10009547_25300 [Sporichthya brevicatena]|uniref:Uncharacterized protein n=1 Tax=Sporichthya brevicatena TaxID=171442 RepID=A0ABN1GWC2_9ACTN